MLRTGALLPSLLRTAVLALAFATSLTAPRMASPTPAATAPPATASPAAASRIAAVEVRLDQPPGRPLDLASYLDLVPGGRLTEDAVRRTLASFHSTGLFAGAEVRRRDGPDGTEVVVVLTTHTWIDSVTLEGELGLRREDLLRAVEVRAGDPLVEDRLLGSVFALQELYAAHGYHQAEVRLRVLQRPQAKRRGALFQISAGPRSRVGEVRFDGRLEGYSSAELAAALRTRPGDPFDPARFAADAERLRAYLVEAGRLRASVGGPRTSWDPETGSVQLTYAVDVGPEIRLEVVGAERRELRNKGLLPFLGEQPYDAALLLRSRSLIRAHYQRQGHYQVRVTAREEAAPDGGIELRIEIEPGPVYRLREIHFTGNRHVGRRELLQLMTTSTPSTLGGGGRLVSTTVAEDLENLRSFYVLQGFHEVEIGPPQVRIAASELELEVPVREGRRRRVVHLRFHGMESLDPAAVRASLPLKRGGPYHPVLLEDAVDVLRALYEDAGYSEAFVAPRLDWSDDATLVDVDFEIREGRRAVLERVILRGHRRTRPEVLRRFADLEEGETVISRRRLLETERELYRLAIFSRVDVEATPGIESSGRRDVVIRVEEGSQFRLAYGASFHSDDGLGGLLSLSRINLGGRGDRLQLDLRANRRDRRFRLIFDQPSLARLDVPITYTLFRQDEERDAFTVRDLGAQVRLTKDLPRMRLGLTYDYRLVDLLETRVDPTDIEREDREVQISSLTPLFLIDRRNDPVETTRGHLTSLQLEYAFPVAGATANFAKLFAQQSGYLNLGRLGVLAANLRLGAIEPLDEAVEPDPLVPKGLASALIPVSERFFAGGRTTHRAYERDELGLVGETLVDVAGELFETGGNALALVNFDYRFPIAGNFGGTVFFDLGNVWADWRNLDPSDLKPGVGLGARYLSPIGPVRFEIGWKLDPQPGEETGPVFFLSLGNPF